MSVDLVFGKHSGVRQAEDHLQDFKILVQRLLKAKEKKIRHPRQEIGFVLKPIPIGSLDMSNTLHGSDGSSSDALVLRRKCSSQLIGGMELSEGSLLVTAPWSIILGPASSLPAIKAAYKSRDGVSNKEEKFVPSRDIHKAEAMPMQYYLVGRSVGYGT